MDEGSYFFHSHGPECDRVCVLQQIASWVTWVPAPSDQCPPHYFDAAFVSDDKGGAIYCRWCGEIRSLEPITIEAPAEERIETPPAVHPPK